VPRDPGHRRRFGPSVCPGLLVRCVLSPVLLLLRLGEISALLIDSTKCFILFKQRSLARAYFGTGIAAQTLGGVI
jgi:hypothetical protein